MNRRKSGILMHISSLHGKEGIGTLGEEAYAFVDFLKKSKQSLWQLLPLGPTGYGNSPYYSFSAFAGNPLFINIENLYNDLGLDIPDEYYANSNNDNNVDFGGVIWHKIPMLRRAAEFYHFESTADKTDYNKFLEENSYWIDAYAFFTALKGHFNQVSFLDWEHGAKVRDPKAMKEYRKLLSKEIDINKNIQFFFEVQWKKLRAYANENRIEMVGDIPIYVAGDSADVWEHPSMFELDSECRPLQVAGCPPDGFSATGQLWGNPIYNWAHMKKTHYKWWVERMKQNFQIFDIVRIDHFRGFADYWSIPGGDPTAEFGKWIPGPRFDLFQAIFKELGFVKIIAEDLGLITPSVHELLEKCQFPGMKVLQFAFDSGEQNEYLPHRFPNNCVVYTGTHDNDTTRGWYEKLPEIGKKFLAKYVGNIEGNEGPGLIKCAWQSVADVVLAPVQDVLNLGNEARMNFPGKFGDNWEWRLKTNELNDYHADFLADITVVFERDYKTPEEIEAILIARGEIEAQKA